MKNLYMTETCFYNGDHFITFNLLSVEENTVTLAVTNRGRITVTDYELFKGPEGLYFEYGCMYEKIYIDDFEEVSRWTRTERSART